MKYCSQCGQQVQDEALFCSGCGEAFTVAPNAAIVNRQEDGLPLPNQATVPLAGESGGGSGQKPERFDLVSENGQQPKASGSGLKKKIILSSLLAILLIAGGFWGWQNLSTEARVQKKLDLAVKYLSDNNYEKAELAFNDAIEIDPKEDQAYQGLAKTYTLQGKFAEANASYEKGLANVPADSQFQLRLSQAGMYIDKGDLQKAETFFKRIIADNKSCIEAYQGLAMVYQQQGNTESAQTILEQGIKENPSEYRLYNELAKLYISLDDQMQSLAMILNSLDLELNQQTAYTLLDELFADNPDELISKIENKAAPKTIAMLEFYTDYSNQKYASGLSLYKNKLEQDAGNLKAAVLAAIAMSKQGDTESAKASIENVLKQASVNKVELDLVRYYLAVNENDKATVLLEKILSSGQFDDVAQAGELLKEISSRNKSVEMDLISTRSLLFDSQPVTMLVDQLSDVLPDKIVAARKNKLAETNQWVTTHLRFDSKAWQYLGDASYDSVNGLSLTQPIEWQEGQVWLKQAVKPPFVMSFDYKAGGGSGKLGQGDGLVFMFNKNKNYSMEKGGSVGFGSSPGYGIEFDSFKGSGSDVNSWDPCDSHIALLKDSYKTHLAYTEKAITKDDQWHSVKIRVEATQVIVMVDKDKVLSWQGTLEQQYTALGFAAATGNANNLHLLRNCSISTPAGALKLSPDLLQPVSAMSLGTHYLDSMSCISHGKFFYINKWTHYQKNGPFEDVQGIVFTRGIGIFSDQESRTGRGYAEYELNLSQKCTFEADLGIEKVWNDGHGTTTCKVYADGKELYKSVFKDDDPTRKVSVQLPAGTKKLRIEVDDLQGPRGTHGTIWGNARIVPAI